MHLIKQTIRFFGASAILMAGLLFAYANTASAQSYWVSNPASCLAIDETSFPGQNCDDQQICGNLGGVAQCYDTETLNPPASNTTTTNGGTDFSAGYNGGYILNCYGTDALGNPYCDNNGAWWCDRNTSCYNTGRDTTCIGNEAASSTCATCRTGYTACDGSNSDIDGCEIRYNFDNCDEIGGVNANNNVNSSCSCVCDTNYLDCDASGAGSGNGCEILNGSACTVGSLPGTWNGCNCEVDKSYFETGTLASYSSADPLLWGMQYGSGPLIQMISNSASTTGGVFYVGNDGKVGVGTSSPSAMLTVGYDAGSQFLVNNAGVVTSGAWQGSAIGLGFGGTGLDLTAATGFLYVSGGAMIASSVIDIINTNLAVSSPLSLTGNLLSLNTGGNWTGTLDGLNGGDIFTLADWFATTSAPQLTSLANLSTVGTITNGTWNGNVIDVEYGGTGSSSWTQYAIPYALDSDTFGEIKLGPATYVLSVNATGDGFDWVSASSTGVVLSKEEVDDYVNSLINDPDSVHTRISVVYDDVNNAMDFIVDGDLSHYDNSVSRFFSTTTDILDADFGGTGVDSSAWDGFAYVSGGVWNASNTISAARLEDVVMLQGDNISLLTNDSGFITDGNDGWDNSYGFITDGNDGWDNSYGFITDGNDNWDNSYGFITLTSLDSSAATGLDYDNGTGAFSLTSGYVIPLIASTSDWQSAYAIVDSNNTNWTNTFNLVSASSSQWNTAYNSRISTAVSPLEISSNQLSIVSGYNIPLNASTTEWNSAYLYRLTTVPTPFTLANNEITLNAAYGIPLLASSSDWTLAYNLVNSGASNWNTAFSWGNHASAGYFATSSGHILPLANGGIGTTTFEANSLLYARAQNAIGEILSNDPGLILQLDASGVPTWVSTTSLGINFGSLSGSLAVEQGGTGQDSSAWDGFAYVSGGVWSASNTIASTRLDSVVMLQGEDISLLNNNAGFISDGNTLWDNSYGFITDGNDGWDNSYGFITLASLDSSATGLHYDNGTGIFSLTSGYVIPLIASTSDWQYWSSWCYWC